MAPASTSLTLLSPAELSYIHSSLSLTPPIRPDSRTSTQFRALVAETNILPGTNGSARVCFADGTEALVGVKAEVERSAPRLDADITEERAGVITEEDKNNGTRGKGQGEGSWVEVSIEIPGFRDDDALPIFLAAMLNEALLASKYLPDRLWINHRFHWKVCIDVLLLSPPLSYPLPLLSLTTHLALLSTRLPKLKSELDEDPLFDDDWEAALYLYPAGDQRRARERPPVTLLVMAVGSNIVFDPTAEELAVAEAIFAVSVGQARLAESKMHDTRDLRLLSIRTIDPPSRLTPHGVPNFLNTAAGGQAASSTQEATAQRDNLSTEGVWSPPRGGPSRHLIARIVKSVMEKGGVAGEVLDGLEAVEIV